MIIVLYGKSGTGKSTALDYISKNSRFKKVTAYTTRPRREEGENYYFVDEDTFHSLDLICKVKYDSNWYGMPISLLESKDQVCILEPTGVASLLRDCENEVLPIKVIRNDRQIRSEERLEMEDKLYDSELVRSLNTISVILDNNGSRSDFENKVNCMLNIYG